MPAGNFQKWSRTTQRIILATTVIVATILLFGLGETIVRVRQWYRLGSLQRIEDTYVIDAVSGLRIPVPGGSFGAIHINSLGYRGPEFPVTKPPASVRVAFLGSSTTYCAEVSADNMAWPALVTEALRARWPDAALDHVNAGVPGYTLSSSLRNLEARVSKLDPDVIVIYEGHNDLTGNALNLAVGHGLVTGPTEQNISWLARYSLMWYLVEKNLKIMSLERTASQTTGKLKVAPEELVPPFRRDLTELVHASSKVADLVVLVTFATQLRREQSPEEQAAAAKTSLYYMPYMTIEGLLDGYESYNHAVRTVAAETGALLVEVEGSIPGDREHFVDTVHFTDRGSHAMARQVSAALLGSQEMQGIIAGEP